MTLGTLALFRGLALIILGPQGVSDFPPGFTEIGFGHVPGTPIPWPFVIFLGARARPRRRPPPDVGRAPGLRIGKNTGAARFSGVRVARVKIGLFVLTGPDRRDRRGRS